MTQMQTGFRAFLLGLGGNTFSVYNVSHSLASISNADVVGRQHEQTAGRLSLNYSGR